MSQILEFPQEELYLDEMAPQQLRDYLAQLEGRLEALDAREPKKMSGEDFDRWAEEHEVLEDAIDEVRELLEDL